jgi:hypothetical protein
MEPFIRNTRLGPQQAAAQSNDNCALCTAVDPYLFSANTPRVPHQCCSGRPAVLVFAFPRASTCFKYG